MPPPAAPAANVLAFPNGGAAQPTTGPFVVTARQRAKAAAWAAALGAGWGVEAICADAGGVGLGIVAPPGDDLAWQVERVAAGFVAFSAETWEELGCFATLGAALDAVRVAAASAEGAAND